MTALAFSPDGKLLAVGLADGTLQLWNAAVHPLFGVLQVSLRLQSSRVLRGNGIASGLPNSVTALAFSSRGGNLLASGNADGTIRLWDVGTGQPAGPQLNASSDVQFNVNAVAFSPDGKLLASGLADGTLQLWNPATGRPVGVPLPNGPLSLANGANDAVNGVAFSPDGKLLASGSADGTVQLWNPATGQRVGPPLQASGRGGVNAVAFAQGDLLASANADGTVRLWDVWLLWDPYAALCADVGAPTGTCQRW